jgi:hypothetical protein
MIQRRGPDMSVDWFVIGLIAILVFLLLNRFLGG